MPVTGADRSSLSRHRAGVEPKRLPPLPAQRMAHNIIGPSAAGGHTASAAASPTSPVAVVVAAQEPALASAAAVADATTTTPAQIVENSESDGAARRKEPLGSPGPLQDAKDALRRTTALKIRLEELQRIADESTRGLRLTMDIIHEQRARIAELENQLKGNSTGAEVPGGGVQPHSLQTLQEEVLWLTEELRRSKDMITIMKRRMAVTERKHLSLSRNISHIAGQKEAARLARADVLDTDLHLLLICLDECTDIAEVALDADAAMSLHDLPTLEESQRMRAAVDAVYDTVGGRPAASMASFGDGSALFHSVAEKKQLYFLTISHLLTALLESISVRLRVQPAPVDAGAGQTKGPYRDKAGIRDMATSSGSLSRGSAVSWERMPPVERSDSRASLAGGHSSASSRGTGLRGTDSNL